MSATEGTHCPFCGEGYPPGRDDAADAWRALHLLDVMVVRLRKMSSTQGEAIARLGRLRVRRRDRLALQRIIIDLECEVGKTFDTLSVYGFGPGPKAGGETALEPAEPDHPQH